jgi:hypothetical protein
MVLPLTAEWSDRTQKGDYNADHGAEEPGKPRADGCQLETINGGGIISWLHRIFGGPGDLRRSTDRPN